jgi:CRP/FNR family transcriptional regulator, nitrogen fixation regulation protein
MPGAVQTTAQPSRATGFRVIPGGKAADPLALLTGYGMTISLLRDRELHAQGDRADFCYRIISGCVRTLKLMEDGRRQIGGFLLAGDCLGFDALDTHDFAAQAVTDVVLRRYRRRETEALMARHASLARVLREMAARELRNAYDRILLLGRKTASERIATFLLEMAARQKGGRPGECPGGGRVALPMSRTDIADHLGLTVETVCRTMTHLRRDGTIVIEPGQVELLCPAALQQMAADPRH